METLEVVDFHNHFVGPGFPLTTLAGVPQGQRAFWEAVNGRLSAPEALFALLEGGVFEELRGLRVVVTALAFGGVLLAAGMPDGSRLRKDVPGPDRRHVFIDTTGMDRVGIRGAIETVGADHVLTGTDWPVVQEKSVDARLQAMFDEFGLAADERRGIAGQNALRLLKASGS